MNYKEWTSQQHDSSNNNLLGISFSKFTWAAMVIPFTKSIWRKNSIILVDVYKLEYDEKIQLF